VRFAGLVFNANTGSIVGANQQYGYLKTVFTQLPNARTLEEIEALLPVPADDVNVAKVS
jgi:hypothetical protein